ncbi:hypothetical protein ISS05_05065 [Candidatus Woesearchaeota archaeon]|nr:hypothetical protein [Candidatus Woesearchaeota archaeon]
MAKKKKGQEHIDDTTIEAFEELNKSFKTGELRCDLSVHDMGTIAEPYLSSNNQHLNKKPTSDDDPFCAMGNTINSAIGFYPIMEEYKIINKNVLKSRGNLATIRLRFGDVFIEETGYDSKNPAKAFLDAYLNAVKSIFKNYIFKNTGGLYDSNQHNYRNR